VWVSLALDFVAHRLESGQADSRDVLSVVTLEPAPRVLLREEPVTAVLYNRIARIHRDGWVVPRGHGPYLPGLSAAVELFRRHGGASGCIQTLLLLSDGRPSDSHNKDAILREIDCLGREWGRRLTFTAVRMGNGTNFDVLEAMVERAADYGCKASLQLPSLSSEAIGQVFSSVATLISTTQSEITDLERRARVRRDVKKEPRQAASRPVREINSSEFDIYPRSQVLRTAYREWHDASDPRKKLCSFDSVDLHHPEAHFVAVATAAFGEGAERFAYRFHELTRDGITAVGKPLVAKSSRLEIDASLDADAAAAAQERFHRVFCSTQQLARQLAVEFNRKLDEHQRRIDPRTPHVSFLDCSVYQLHESDGRVTCYLVEERLDPLQWKKWNSNNGYVEGMAQAPSYISHATLRDAYTKLDAEDLGVIVEEPSEQQEDYYDDYDDEFDDAGDHSFGCDDGEDSLSVLTTHRRPLLPAVFSASDVAQAFSHFSYFASGRRRLVCDLQGVHDEEMGLLRLTDPVIHYHHPSRADGRRRRVHGSTDRGRKGLALFFGTHECNPLCRLVLRGFRSSVQERHARS
jgi:hypothetical protein